MGVKIHGTFTGELGTKMVHVPSGVALKTEPPTDNGGKGDSFSPTDLLATAYGSCMMSVIAIHAKKQGWDLAGMSVDVEKIMSPDLPRKINELVVQLHLPKHLSPAQRDTLVTIGRNCPVALSVAPSMTITFSVN